MALISRFIYLRHRGVPSNGVFYCCAHAQKLSAQGPILINTESGETPGRREAPLESTYSYGATRGSKQPFCTAVFTRV